MLFRSQASCATLRGFDYAAYSRAKKQALGEMAELAWINGKRKGDAKQKAKFIEDYIENADNDIINMAHEYGKYLTFQEDGALAEGFTTAKQFLNAMLGFGGEKVSKGKRVGGFGLGDLVIKYAKTPANLIQTALDYSPVGIIESAAILGKAVMKGDYANRKREIVEGLSRGLVGSMGTSMMGAILYDLGILTGDDDDWSKDAFLRDQGGMSSFQVNLTALGRFLTTWRKADAKPQPGDYLFSYDWLQPMAINLAIGTSVMETLNNNKGLAGGGADAFETGIDALGAGANTIMEQPLLQGLMELMPSKWGNENVIDRLGKVAEGIPAQMVPSFVNHIRSIADNTRNVTSDPKSYQRAFNRMVDRIPFLQDTLPDAYKTFGIDEKSVKYENGTNVFSNAFEVLLNPGYLRQYGVKPEAAHILGIYEESGDDKMLQDRGTTSIKIVKKDMRRIRNRRTGKPIEISGDSQPIKLKGEDRSKLQALIGRYSLEEFKKIESSLRNVEADEQAKRVARAMNKGYDRARKWFIKDRLQSYFE